MEPCWSRFGIWLGRYCCSREAPSRHEMVARTQVIFNMTLMILHVLPQLFHFARFPFMSGKVSLGGPLGLQMGPSGPEDGAKTLQEVAGEAFEGHKTAQWGQGHVQEGPRGVQETSGRSQSPPKAPQGAPTGPPRRRKYIKNIVFFDVF